MTIRRNLKLMLMKNRLKNLDEKKRQDEDDFNFFVLPVENILELIDCRLLNKVFRHKRT